MALIYLLDPDKKNQELFAQHLYLVDHVVEKFSLAAELLKRIENRKPDIIILEVNLPDMPGFSLAKILHEKFSFPFMFLTTEGSESNRIIGFELGADEYIVKPYSIKEAVLRVNKVLRLCNRIPSKKTMLIYNYDKQIMEIDSEQHKIFIDNELINLTAGEWKILLYLIQNEGSSMGRDNISSHCLEVHFNGYNRIVDSHIKKIRAKIKEPGWIETVRGHGYRFVGKKI